MIETTILAHLINNEEYTKKVIAYLKDEYFQDKNQKLVFNLINNYIDKYKSLPTKEALFIDLDAVEGVNQETIDKSRKIIASLDSEESTQLDWLVDQTEKFCQEKAVFNAIMQSIRIIDKKEGDLSKGSIPKILSDALAVSFDTRIGHDYIEDWEERWEYYHTTVSRIPFDLEYFNKVTNGGLPPKTLSVFLAGVNVGKTQLMCHCAGNNLRDGYNVLYITLEMSEEEISKRIDANLLDIPMDDIDAIPKDIFKKKIDRMREKTKGKLMVREYPTSQASTAHFRHLLNELRLKKTFKPDIVYVDYINICASSRIRRGQANSYEYVKAIAEELRGLAVEFELPIVSATQLNRSGFGSSDIDLTDTAESFGLPATADFMLGLITNDELEEMGQILCKQLKNRLGNKQTNKKFIIGVDRVKMRFYDVDQSAQEDIHDGPVMDNSDFGERWDEEEEIATKPKNKKFDKSKFKDFK